MTVDEKTYREVVDFIYKEAELLDEGRMPEWLNLVTDDIEYRIPVRISKERAHGSGLLDNSFYINDDKRALSVKVEKLLSEYSWSEDPPSRTRHMVANIMVEPGRKSDEVEVKSNVLFIRNRLDKLYSEIVSYARRDALRKVDGGWKLAKRLVILDHSVLMSENITILY